MIIIDYPILLLLLAVRKVSHEVALIGRKWHLRPATAELEAPQAEEMGKKT
jgi:hypothetical protein